MRNKLFAITLMLSCFMGITMARPLYDSASRTYIEDNSIRQRHNQAIVQKAMAAAKINYEELNGAYNQDTAKTTKKSNYIQARK